MSERSVFCLKSALDLNGETSRATQRQNSAIIVADVRRFAHVINTDGVFGTRTTLVSVLARVRAGIRINSTIRSKAYIKAV
jgi:hypothetical protein